MELILLIAVLSFVTIFNLFSSYFKASKNIKGKVVLITGGGNGLGKGLCLEFAKLGCDVVIADIDIEAANKTSNEITEKFNIKSKSYKVDVSNFDEIESFKNQVYEDFGKVDILINNAGIISYSTIFKESINFIDKLIKVNFTGCIIITKVFLEDMIKRNSGHIVSISSLGGLYHIPTSVNYCATKFGVTGFMLGLREFLRCAKLDNQIYLTTIYPDVIATQDHVINSVSKNYNILGVERVVKESIYGILRNEAEISVPKYTSFFAKCFQCLPHWLQNFIRDKLRRESDLFYEKGLDLNQI